MKKYRDHYFKQAKLDNYPARSVYKLQEMNKAFKLLSPGLKVLDLGASPGSWSMYAAQKTGPRGLVVAADLKPLDCEIPEQVVFALENVFERSTEFEELLNRHAPFDLVISDMAPKTTGVKITDQSRSLDLAQEAFNVADIFLRKGGAFVVKIFQGPDVSAFQREIRSCFVKLASFKPKSSRSESKELFFVGLGFKGKS